MEELAALCPGDSYSAPRARRKRKDKKRGDRTPHFYFLPWDSIVGYLFAPLANDE
jgi:hypothetical protein